MKRLLVLLLSVLLVFMSVGCSAADEQERVALGKPGELGVSLAEPAEVIDIAKFYNGVELGGRQNNEWGMLAARSFQGLINKTKPRLYIERVGQDKWGIQTEPLKQEAIETIGERKLNVLPVDTSPDHTGYQCFWTIFYKYHEEINKLYVFDEYSSGDRLYAIMNVAVMLAGRNGGVAVPRPLAEQIRAAGYTYEEVDVEEYCGFGSNDNVITINQWAVDNLQEGSNQNMVFALNPVTRTWYQGMTESDQFPTAYDMAVALDAFIYVPIPYTAAGRLLEEKVLEYYDDAIPVIGWPGPYENDWISHLAECGKTALTIDWEYNNGSLWCAFEPYDHTETIAPIPAEDTIETYNDTVYIAFTYSDGDAFHYSERDLVGHLNNPVIMDTDIPMGWTIPSVWRQLNPVLLEYFFSKMRPGLDEFMQGPSGITYTYASRLPEEAYETYLNSTKDIFDRLGINMVNYWDIVAGNTNSMVGDDISYLEKYVEIVQPDAIFRGQSSRTGNYMLIGDTVLVEEVGNMNGSGCQTSADILQAVEKMIEYQKTGANAVRPNGPVFIMINVNAWGDPIEAVVPVAVTTLKERADYNYQFVTPSRLVGAIRDYEAGGSLDTPNPDFA